MRPAVAPLFESRTESDTRNILGDAIRALAEDEQAVLMRYKCGNYDLNQIARTLGVSETVVKRRLFSAYEKLVGWLGPFISGIPSATERSSRASAETTAGPAIIKFDGDRTSRREVKDHGIGSNS